VSKDRPSGSSDQGRPGVPSGRARASDLLNDFLTMDHRPRIALGDVLAALGDRAFGALLLILSIPNVLPVPGLSTATGVPMVLIGAQMAFGRSGLWLPRRVTALTLDRDAFLAVLRRARPWAERVERHLRPRLSVMVGARAERGLGLAVVALATVLALPIVFGNQPPAFAIALIALGLIERDGVFVLAGLGSGLIALAIVAAVLLGLGKAGGAAWHYFFG
jgi:hypothetical protein